MKTVRIGCGAGFAGDRMDAASFWRRAVNSTTWSSSVWPSERSRWRSKRRLAIRGLGYDPLLAARMEAVLPLCREYGTTIITNMGAANPVAAATVISRIARRLGLQGLSIAAVTGDDVRSTVLAGEFTVSETGQPVRSLGESLVSANAYIGAEAIRQALELGADVVITGRAADPSLFVAPLSYELGWGLDAWNDVARATLVGHLLECAGQLTGGYFADPGYKEVAGLDDLGFPLAEVPERGAVLITKVADTGGMVHSSRPVRNSSSTRSTIRPLTTRRIRSQISVRSLSRRQERTAFTLMAPQGNLGPMC